MGSELFPWKLRGNVRRAIRETDIPRIGGLIAIGYSLSDLGINYRIKLRAIERQRPDQDAGEGAGGVGVGGGGKERSVRG